MAKSPFLAAQSALIAVSLGLTALLVTLGAFSAQATGPEPILCQAQVTSLGHGDIELNLEIQNKTDHLKLSKILSVDEFEVLLDMSFTAEEVAETLADYSLMEKRKAKRRAEKLDKIQPEKDSLFKRLMGKLQKSVDPLGLSKSIGTTSNNESNPFDDGDELVLVMPIEEFNTDITIKVDPVGLTLFPKIYGPKVKKLADQKELLHFFTGMEFKFNDPVKQIYRYSGFATHCTLEKL